MLKKSLLAAIFLGATITVAGAFDVKALIPCKPAASKYCDRTDLTATTRNLLRCEARLAAVSNRVGERCRAVLRRYGQL
jgi:hypothetical protein